ncbi:hypothetical protein MKW98_011576 [Papaver atlanticum]|uniref:Uncharacterized protein n=1 Tax=Papaver atlanticum TaxID=357466 RepID=A0AAD4S9R6_9MAGN|nr:hypothetical protein MKW98_011576 [Papaver atlanticum]
MFNLWGSKLRYRKNTGRLELLPRKQPLQTFITRIHPPTVASAVQFHLPLTTATFIHHQHSTCLQATASAASYVLRCHHSTVTSHRSNISSCEFLRSADSALTTGASCDD